MKREIQESHFSWNSQSRRWHPQEEIPPHWNVPTTTGVIAYAVNQTHKFFSTFCPRRAHFSNPNFPLSRVWESLASCERRRRRRPARNSLSFSSASGKRVRDEALRDSEYVRGRTTLRSPPSSLTLRAPPAVRRRPPPVARCPPSCRPACSEMTNVTCHGHKGKLSSTTRHGNRVALAGHAVATREEKSGRFISQKGARQDLCRLSPTDALAVSPRWRRTAWLTITNDSDLCFLLIVF
jgi:hypothetical protein